MPTPQGGLWVQHFTTGQDEIGKSSSTQAFPIHRFSAGHGFFGMKGLDKDRLLQVLGPHSAPCTTSFYALPPPMPPMEL